MSDHAKGLALFFLDEIDEAFPSGEKFARVHENKKSQ
jgi:hypothetical protein